MGVSLSGRVLLIGCGGVANVAIRKCCQADDVFTELSERLFRDRERVTVRVGSLHLRDLAHDVFGLLPRLRVLRDPVDVGERGEIMPHRVTGELAVLPAVVPVRLLREPGLDAEGFQQAVRLDRVRDVMVVDFLAVGQRAFRQLHEIHGDA